MLGILILTPLTCPVVQWLEDLGLGQVTPREMSCMPSLHVYRSITRSRSRLLTLLSDDRLIQMGENG
jgi:hypothetical protein